MHAQTKKWVRVTQCTLRLRSAKDHREPTVVLQWVFGLITTRQIDDVRKIVRTSTCLLCPSTLTEVLPLALALSSQSSYWRHPLFPTKTLVQLPPSFALGLHLLFTFVRLVHSAVVSTNHFKHFSLCAHSPFARVSRWILRDADP